MNKHFQNQEADDEMVSYVPTFDETALSSPSLRRVRRYAELEATNAMVRSARIISHHKVAKVSMLCQGELEEVVTACMSRNPRPHAAANLCALAQANAEYLYRLIRDDRDPYWR